jgi:hypothetical protein
LPSAAPFEGLAPASRSLTTPPHRERVDSNLD